MKQQKGFTLVEMAIVLVIIGLLLGGVLKGQELIDNSRIKNAVNDLKGVSAAYNGYLDRFQRLPGDDGPVATLQARGGNWATAVAGNNNGILEITEAQTFTGAGENDEFFRHLRYAGFISGDPALAGVAALPRNAFGGLTGVTGAAVFGFPAGGRYVCMGSVPGKAARAIDATMDDGAANTGSVRAIVGVNNLAPTLGAPAVAAYSDDSTYTMCTTL
ncbi:MAG TPA: prepilin-type N-terminal cleavage/methylation domain-containing protein [Thiotrichales bacterium]|nr:prepilin-type N-terminal cleavage/methylation domain-containing protein [Thiotrichales bacterium]